ncbi:MAG: M48 family metallopeptidase [Deltaproteobacteria bacterium]
MATLQAKMGEKLRLRALSDFRAGQSARKPTSLVLARVIAAFVLGIPGVIGLFGVVVMALGFPNVGLLALGALAIALAWLIRPRHLRVPKHFVTAQAAPKLFGLLGEIAADLKAPLPDAVVIDDDFNASIGHYGRGKRQQLILRIGAPLWLSLNEPERLALIAHEFGHTVNNDPARRGLIAAALQVLWQWRDLWGTPSVWDTETNTNYGSGEGLLSRIMTGTMRAILTALIALLMRLMFVESQRAEYLADALSAKVAGSDAAIALMRTTTLFPLVVQALNGTYITENAKTDLLRLIANAIRAADPQARDKLYQAAEAEGISLDATHPPTKQRIRFLSDLAQPRGPIKLSKATADAIDRELSPEFARIETILRRHLMVQ